MDKNATPPPEDRATRLARLRREYEELSASLPAHSVPASMLIRLEELESEIAALKAESGPASSGKSSLREE